jgi:leader peptidase (prepilin peptidase)/N-methyltransferase
MLSYRLISGDSLLIARSFCPDCHHQLAWYDLIPLISFITLQGKCRYCTQPISILYPLIELLTPIALLTLWYTVPEHYFFSYFLYFSALIITIRTDLEFMLISRFTSIYLIPIGVMLCASHYLPITWQESMLGCMSGYFFLTMISKLFTYFTSKEGLGQGDVELIATIGSFTGIFGWWISLLLGSLLGSCIGIAYLTLFEKERSTRIPFGPFLAIGSMLYVLYEASIMELFFKNF